jgi:hypothetical protein
MLDALIRLERIKKNTEGILAQAFMCRDVSLLEECILIIDKIKIIQKLITSILSNS